MSGISEILSHASFTDSDLIQLLQCKGPDRELLFQKAGTVKKSVVGNKVYFRGLIEFSNVCTKDCYYCGIRCSNNSVHRYNLSDSEIFDLARYADRNRYGSVVLQSGEISSASFTERIEHLITGIKAISNSRLGITLSVGEQPETVYQRWFDAGAHRYLLRIETTNQFLYRKIHPDNQLHDFHRRLGCLYSLQKIGFQTGTGVMIGLPFQTAADLAGDLRFFERFGIDMVGMGPYIEHPQTPLYAFRQELLPLEERFEISLKMIAILRILMSDINIAATTALQAIHPQGREMGIRVGANIIMPNITPGYYHRDYQLYENKRFADDPMGITMPDCEPGYGEWGDSLHFKNRRAPFTTPGQVEP